MQLTSTTDPAPAPAATGRGALLARLNNPVAVALIGFIGWLGYVLARWQVWAAGRITLFIMSGSVRYSHPAQMVPKISHVPSLGYDGQFYYRFALDPFNWSPTAYGITIDHNYRYTRIGYSLVAWILSGFGHATALPAVLVIVNLVCVAVMGYLGAKFARESGRHALCGLLFVAYFGLAISVGRDTSEPLADACMLGGLLAYRHSKYVLAALLVCYAVFTNEPVLVLSVAIAVLRLWQFWRKQARPGKPDLIWVAPGLLYLALELAEKVAVKGASGGVADATSNLTLPFKALVPAVVRDFRLMSWTHPGLYDYNLIEFIALAVFVVFGFLVLRASAATIYEKAAFVGFVLVEMVLASGQFWDSTFGDGRTYIECFLLALVLLLATPAGTVTTAVRRAHASLADRVFATDRVITNKRLGWLSAVAVVVLVLVARRHILHQ